MERVNRLSLQVWGEERVDQMKRGEFEGTD